MDINKALRLLGAFLDLLASDRVSDEIREYALDHPEEVLEIFFQSLRKANLKR